MGRTGGGSWLSIGLLVLVTCTGALCVRPNRTVLPVTSSGFVPEITGVTSESVSIAWPRARDMTGVTIAVSAEPPEQSPTAVATLATLDASAAGHQLRGLAPGATAFLTVTMSFGGRSERREFHVTPPRPSRTDPTGAVRSAHLVAPDTLLLVLTGDRGETWADDDYVVRRADGENLAVRAVHRRSFPVAQPAYELGYGGEDDLATVVVDHHIFLELAEAVGQQEVLQIEGPGGIDVVLPYSDRYLETPAIQLNQVGYNPRAGQRFAYLSMWMGDGGPLSLDDFPAEAEAFVEPVALTTARTAAVEHLPITRRVARDLDSGTEVKQIDLFTVPARDGAVYRIRIPGVGISYPTAVSETAAFKAFYVVARGLYHNRWGGELDAAHTAWSRPTDHPTVFTGERDNSFEMYPEGAPQNGSRPLRGGHHDAGDFDQRPSHTVVAQLLMRAFELNPEAFTDRQLTLPESGNRIPDLLDEALWSVAAWEQLQEEDGGVRAGVESHRHPWGIYLANEDPLPYFTFARDPNMSARAAGLFAQASRLITEFDPDHARRLRDRAERAHAYAERHGALPAFRMYAASELFRLTGEAQYGQEMEGIWRSFGPDGMFNAYAVEHLELGDYVREGRPMGDYALGYLLSEAASEDLRAAARRWFTMYADRVADRVVRSEHGHRNARPHDRAEFGWGQASVMGRYLDPIISILSLGDLPPAKRQHYFDALSLSADYILGANPLGMSFITGLGSRRPEEPLHLDSLVWIKRGAPPVPGIPVYGPVTNLPGHDWYRYGRAAFHPAFEELPLGLRYADIRSFVNNNEFTVWECQAPHAELFAALICDGLMPPASWLPGGADDANPLPTGEATSRDH